jgi:hypothetical protein
MMMSTTEATLLALVVGGAIFYLARRAWVRFGGRRSGCCGGCPVGSPKIRLAGEAKRESIGER